MTPHRAATLSAWMTSLVMVGSACRRVPTPTVQTAPVEIPVQPHVPEPVAPIMIPVVAVAAPTAREIVRHITDSVLVAPMWRNARWGLLIIDATTGDTIVTHDADRLFMPASNQKLLTSAVALQQLGPDYQWRTPVLLRGHQHGGTWNGDLLVSGSGDPSFSDTLRSGDASSAFAPVVRALARRGITRITGSVLTVGDAFPGATTGYGWEYDDSDEPYGATVDELLYNEGELTLTVRGGRRPGVPLRVTRTPTATYPPLVMHGVTRAASARGARLRAAYDSIGATIEITGTLGVGDSARFSLAFRHPNDAFRAALREKLVGAGIRVLGRTSTPREADALRERNSARAKRITVATMDTLTVLESLPLREILPRMQKPSQNQIAELLFRTTGRVVSGDGSADSARAVGLRTMAMWGVTSADVAYRDGSGVSRHDYVTPRALISTLDYMRRSPWFAVYRDALPLAGVDGTIANRLKGTLAEGNAHAKTGTLDKARSLSGYVTSVDGHLLLFSMLCNNFTVPNREVERVQDLLVSTLASLRFADGGVAPGR